MDSNLNCTNSQDFELSEYKKLHDKICQHCDGCRRDQCSFKRGYERGRSEEKTNSLSVITLENELIAILGKYCGERGDSEGAVETLERIVREREILLRNAIKEKVFKLL